MARIRTIKPEFFTSADIADLTPVSRLFYAFLWTESDREGWLYWKPRNFQMRFFPLEQHNIQELGDELKAGGLVHFDTVDGEVVCGLAGFAKHQVINNREAESMIKPRVKVACTRVKAEGKEGREGKGDTRERGPASKKFKKPTVDEVRSYVTEKGYRIDPAKFVDYNESKGWVVGKAPMKDWQAAVRTWHGRENENKPEPKPYGHGGI